ncbi:MAG: hypothetical protein FWG77_04895 [Treponema sp.]|nr:hypothetical protein [Treponema sp.]
MQLETFKGLLYEIRDLAKGGGIYASNISDDSIDAAFNLAMYSVIQRNAQTILRLFDIIEFGEVGEAVERKIQLEYSTGAV